MRTLAVLNTADNRPEKAKNIPKRLKRDIDSKTCGKEESERYTIFVIQTVPHSVGRLHKTQDKQNRESKTCMRHLPGLKFLKTF
jgi:hypothetical protein